MEKRLGVKSTIAARARDASFVVGRARAARGLKVMRGQGALFGPALTMRTTLPGPDLRSGMFVAVTSCTGVLLLVRRGYF